MTPHRTAEVLTEVYGYLFAIHKLAKEGGADSRCVDIKCFAADGMYHIDKVNKELADDLIKGEVKV